MGGGGEGGSGGSGGSSGGSGGRQSNSTGPDRKPATSVCLRGHEEYQLQSRHRVEIEMNLHRLHLAHSATQAVAAASKPAEYTSPSSSRRPLLSYWHALWRIAKSVLPQCPGDESSSHASLIGSGGGGGSASNGSGGRQLRSKAPERKPSGLLICSIHVANQLQSRCLSDTEMYRQRLQSVHTAMQAAAAVSHEAKASAGRRTVPCLPTWQSPAVWTHPHVPALAEASHALLCFSGVADDDIRPSSGGCVHAPQCMPLLRRRSLEFVTAPRERLTQRNITDANVLASAPG